MLFSPDPLPTNAFALAIWLAITKARTIPNADDGVAGNAELLGDRSRAHEATKLANASVSFKVLHQKHPFSSKMMGTQTSAARIRATIGG